MEPEITMKNLKRLFLEFQEPIALVKDIRGKTSHSVFVDLIGKQIILTNAENEVGETS